MTDEQSDEQSDDLYKKDLLGDPIIPKTQRRNSKRRPEPVSEPPPARPTRPRKVDVHLPKRSSFLSLVSAAIAFIAWHAYQFQFKGVMPGVETDKMPPAIYGAIVAVVCIVCFGWFLGECGSAFTRQFQTDANRPPWHRTKHRWIVPSAHLALGIVVLVCVWLGSFALPYGIRDTGQFIADAQATFSKPPTERTQIAEVMTAPAPLNVPPPPTQPPGDSAPLKEPSSGPAPSAPIITGSLPPPPRKRKAAAPQQTAQYPLDPLLAKICDLFETLIGADGKAAQR